MGSAGFRLSAPQSCRNAAFRFSRGHRLGAELSAIRHFGVGAVLVLAATAAARAEECRLVAIGSATVRAASAAGIALDDGRVVRLAGLDVADPARAAPPPGTALTLKRIGKNETDRYGRVIAHVFTGEGGNETWFQAELLRHGLARVARVGDAACAQALLAEEEKARSAKLGLWAEPVYVMSKAEEPAEVLKSRGRFTLVEGTVLSVRESGGTIYVNFGRRWSEDFTVTIARRNERAFAAAGLPPKSLAGRRVRIRGWIEERGGPWVEAARPEQIEVMH
jgi:hypothetical protein